MTHLLLENKESLCVRTFSELTELWIEKRQRPVGRADRDNIRRVNILLCECFHTNKIDIAFLDSDVIEDFQRFCINKGYDRKYINQKLVGFIKTLCNWGALRKNADGLPIVPKWSMSNPIRR